MVQKKTLDYSEIRAFLLTSQQERPPVVGSVKTNGKWQLLELTLDSNSDDFVFDNQMLSQILWLGYQVAEVSCPTKYFPEASSINLYRSIKYGFGCLITALQFRLTKINILQSKLFPN